MAPCEERGTGGGLPAVERRRAGGGRLSLVATTPAKPTALLPSCQLWNGIGRGMHLRNALVPAARNHSRLAALAALAGR